jgi:hypothetical protein
MEAPVSNWEVIRWWEIRRIPYNLALLAIGMSSLFAAERLMDEPVLSTGLTAFVYGAMANACYTLGWVVELAARRNNEVSARLRGRELFWLGLWLSCLLTAAPFWFGLVFLVMHRHR